MARRLGAASGALGGALTDYGVNDALHEGAFGDVSSPATPRLFVLINKMTTDKVLDALKGTGGVVMKTSLDHTQRAETARRDLAAR